MAPLVLVCVMTRQLDADSWYVLAEGKQITESGIYYTDQLSMHEDLNITVQNYGFAVFFYWIFSFFGASGIYITMIILNVIICFLLYKICMVISKKNVNLSLIIMLATDSVLALSFVVTRAQMVSYVFFLGLIYILEMYIKTGRKKLLLWLPIISLLQVNLHASLWPMLIVVMAVYIIDGIKIPKLHLQGYRIRPLIIVGIIMMLVGLINPYGVKMLLLMFSSYGNERFMNYIVELHPFDLRDLVNIITYVAIAISLILQIYGSKRGIRVRYLLMFFGFLALGLNSTKGLSQFILVMFLPLASMYKNTIVGAVRNKKIRNMFLAWASVVSISCFVAMLVLVMSNMRNVPYDGLVLAVDAMDESLDEGIDKKDLKVYSGYDSGIGGYLEFRDYPVYMDSRGEVYLKANNGKEDILYEWFDFLDGKIKSEELINKYNFDYIVAQGEYDPFYSLSLDGYKILFDDADTQTKVFKRAS